MCVPISLLQIWEREEPGWVSGRHGHVAISVCSLRKNVYVRPQMYAVPIVSRVLLPASNRHTIRCYALSELLLHPRVCEVQQKGRKLQLGFNATTISLCNSTHHGA